MLVDYRDEALTDGKLYSGALQPLVDDRDEVVRDSHWVVLVQEPMIAAEQRRLVAELTIQIGQFAAQLLRQSIRTRLVRRQVPLERVYLVAERSDLLAPIVPLDVLNGGWLRRTLRCCGWRGRFLGRV